VSRLGCALAHFIHCCVQDGLTPLHYAAWGAQLQAALLLLGAGAAVDALSTVGVCGRRG
jgi:hypothetical protein